MVYFGISSKFEHFILYRFFAKFAIKAAELQAAEFLLL